KPNRARNRVGPFVSRLRALIIRPNRASSHPYQIEASMSSASAIKRASRRRLQRPALAGLLAVTFLAAPAAAAQKSKAAPGPVVARCESVAGTLLQREAGKSWAPVKAGATLRAGSLLVALPRAEILSKNGAVKLELLADIGQRGPLPVLESAVGLTFA